MSIKTWKKEFYSKNPSKRMNKIDAIKHSIKKWEGLTKENLDRHGVSTYLRDLIDEDGYLFEISADTCSLCIKYKSDDDCGKCPLYEKLGRSCGEFISFNANKDGWRVWVRDQNPDLMIENLKSLLVED